jgi:oxygen-dependent protoporphyrinogen oxidase
MSATGTAYPVIVVGAGISGLTIAWHLQQAGLPVLVLDAGSVPGGTIGTIRQDGFQIETGPNSTLQKPGHEDDAIGRVLAGLGIEHRKRCANPQAEIRYILRDGRLLPLPGSPLAFAGTPLFSWQAKLRLLLEPWIRAATREETLADFVRRRLGQEFLDYTVEPFISGVYAGDPYRLSATAAVPRIHTLEQKYGSLIRGAMAMGKINRKVGMPRGTLISFDDGMAVLPTSLASALHPGALQLRSNVTRISRDGEQWQIYWNTQEDDGGQGGCTTHTARCHQLVLAIPAYRAAPLVATLAPEASTLLQSIPYAAVVSAATGYQRRQVAHGLNGFGFLVPRRESMRILGTLFSSTLFERRAPDDTVLLTTFIGGARDVAAFHAPDAVLLATIGDNLNRCLSIDGPPQFASLQRHPWAIPQYVMGHLERIAALDRILAPYSGLYLQANWRGGVSVSDCMRNAERVAGTILGTGVHDRCSV